MSTTRIFLALAALVTASSLWAAAPTSPETPAEFAARTRWWREARFGMFIHWGLYAVPADATDRNGNKAAAEWYISNKQAQQSDYVKFAPQFNPTQFDAKAWVRVAKDAGMKYIVITSKHHEGFSMFDTKQSDYSIIRATPFHRDPLKELADECRRQGIRLGFYYSVMDWHHPDYLPRRAWETSTRPAGSADLDRYITYMKAQLRELLTNYGPVAVIWFDGSWEHNAAELHADEVVDMIRSLQPNIIINNRINRPEDFDTPEQTIPASALPQGRLWETCMTMNDTWGYGKNDDNWKSAPDLIRKLCDIASKGGNFLLNVGPKATGEFPQESVDRLADVGKWMRVNGEAIYGTQQSPFRRLPFNGRATVKGSTLYLHVFEWPEGGLALPGLKTAVRSARVLGTGERLAVTSSENGPGLARPKTLDPVATVVALRLAGPPEVTTPTITASADGGYTLAADAADLQGRSIRVETIDGSPSIGFWTDAADAALWTLTVTTPGTYRATLNAACTPESAGSTVRLELDGKPAGEPVVVPSTGSWQTFQDLPVPGSLDLTAGRHTLRLVPVSMPHGAVMNLRKVTLAPVG